MKCINKTSTYSDNINKHFNKYFPLIEINFVKFIAQYAVVLASRSVRSGHICQDLNTLAGNAFCCGITAKELP